MPHSPSISTTNTLSGGTTTGRVGVGMDTNSIDKLYTKTIELMQEQAEYHALRVFMSINHRDILVQFDAAFAARKRMGVGT